MTSNNYDYDKKNFPSFNDAEIDKIRYSIVGDAYWNAKNLKSIIEESYDISRIYRLPNRKEEIIFSLVALSCELFLKSLAYACGKQKTVVKKHDLSSLFSLLTNDIKLAIKEKMKEPEFDKMIEENKDIFTLFRYSYEMKGYMINASFLLELMKVLNNVCDEYYPKSITRGVEGLYKCGLSENGVFYRIIIK